MPLIPTLAPFCPADSNHLHRGRNLSGPLSKNTRKGKMPTYCARVADEYRQQGKKKKGMTKARPDPAAVLTEARSFSNPCSHYEGKRAIHRHCRGTPSRFSEICCLMIVSK